MSLEALGAIENASTLVNKAAVAVANSANRQALTPHLHQLTKALYELEYRAHQDLSARAHAPLPAPNQQKVGDWATRLRKNGPALAPLMRLSPPQWILETASQIQNYSRQVIETSARPPSSQGFGSPAGMAVASAAAVAVPGVGAKKMIALAMQLAAAAGTAAMGYGLHRYEKKMRNDGLIVDDDAEPQQVQQKSQHVLDNELPGAMISLIPTPDGDFIASVKRGNEVIARTPARKPKDAAGQAVKRALEYDEIKKHGDVEGEILGKRKKRNEDVVIDVTPKKEDDEAA